MPRISRRSSSAGSEKSQTDSQTSTKSNGKKQNGKSNAKQNRDKWVGIFNDEVLCSNTEDSRPSVISLKHPRTGLSALYVASDDRTKLFQLNVFGEKFRSWFIGDTVHSDGSLYVTTPVDPLFLVLPYLCSEEKSKRFMTLDQLVCDEGFAESSVLSTSCDMTQMECIADSKDIGGDVLVFRYNREKTLEWLKSKTDAVAQALQSQKINVSAKGSHSAIFVRSKNDDASKESYLEYAHGIVSDQLSLRLEEELRVHLGLPDPNETKIAEGSENEPERKKAKLDLSEGPTEDYSIGVDLKKDKKNQKLSAAQKQLSKVDKSGMKSIASFFKKS